MGVSGDLLETHLVEPNDSSNHTRASTLIKIKNEIKTQRNDYRSRFLGQPIGHIWVAMEEVFLESRSFPGLAIFSSSSPALEARKEKSSVHALGPRQA